MPQPLVREDGSVDLANIIPFEPVRKGQKRSANQESIASTPSHAQRRRIVPPKPALRVQNRRDSARNVQKQIRNYFDYMNDPNCFDINETLDKND